MGKVRNETIAAISTPIGKGGIGIVRMSGDASIDIARKFFSPAKDTDLKDAESHSVLFGCIKAPGEKEIIDEVLVTLMKAPRTYTKENIIEISCHGGIMPLKRVLDLCLDTGARLAEPGEFTKRAFINGRIDLSQAEAVLDIINSETESSLKIAARQLKGLFSAAVSELRDEMLDILSMVELSIDFSQEDVGFSSTDAFIGKVEASRTRVKKLIDTSDKGMVIRDGASVVICGKPNVGKSSLMNAFLRDERVIVTPIAGTTRDVVEESIVISGVKVTLSDTAGIIETEDSVELEGIKRSKEKLEKADIVLFVLDLSRPFSEKDRAIYEILGEKKKIVVANKSDLNRAMNIFDVKQGLNVDNIINCSVLTKNGLENIENAIADKLFNGDAALPEGAVVTNLRHRKCLERALLSMERAFQTAQYNFSAELIASDLNDSVHQLGLIIGESVEDDILERIFSKFCIGK